jgi:hypothetical protein
MQDEDDQLLHEVWTTTKHVSLEDKSSDTKLYIFKAVVTGEMDPDGDIINRVREFVLNYVAECTDNNNYEQIFAAFAQSGFINEECYLEIETVARTLTSLDVPVSTMIEKIVGTRLLMFPVAEEVFVLIMVVLYDESRQKEAFHTLHNYVTAYVGPVIRAMCLACPRENCTDFLTLLLRLLRSENLFETIVHKLYRITPLIVQQFYSFREPNQIVEDVFHWYLEFLDEDTSLGLIYLFDIVDMHSNLIVNMIELLHEKLRRVIVTCDSDTVTLLSDLFSSSMVSLLRHQSRGLGLRMFKVACHVMTEQQEKLRYILYLFSVLLHEDVLEVCDIEEMIPSILESVRKHIGVESYVLGLFTHLVIKFTAYRYLLDEYDLLEKFVMYTSMDVDARDFYACAEALIVMLRSDHYSLMLPVNERVFNNLVLACDTVQDTTQAEKLHYLVYLMLTRFGNTLENYLEPLMKMYFAVPYHRPIPAILVVFNYEAMLCNHPDVVRHVFTTLFNTEFYFASSRVLILSLACTLIEMNKKEIDMNEAKVLDYLQENIFASDTPQLLQMVGETLIKLQVRRSDRPIVQLAISMVKNSKIGQALQSITKFTDIAVKTQM